MSLGSALVLQLRAVITKGLSSVSVGCVDCLHHVHVCGPFASRPKALNSMTQVPECHVGGSIHFVPFVLTPSSVAHGLARQVPPLLPAVPAHLLARSPVMADAARDVKVAKPPGGGQRRHGPAAAARGVSPEAFLQGTSIAWAHLQPEERKAIRAACSSCRQLHDRLVIDLRISLGHDRAQHEEQRQHQHQPAPQELRASLGAVMRRGARPQSLTVRFRDTNDDGRQAQL